jgi:phage-related protein
MEMAIQSGASMISSVGGDTAEAARLMDLAIVDMSDNVNKMGTSMESVQNAYRGFAKGNFTMLDNLALGYGGTKEEMSRLLKDATALSGVKYDIDSYADIVQAIHIVQENIGITGTTAKEASETISGSVSSMKAAWQNLLVGMADPAADLSGLIGNVVDTAETAFGNILPVAEQALAGIASFVEQIAPVIAEKLPDLVKNVLPSILNAATTLITALVDALPTLIKVLVDEGPKIVNQLIEKILEMLPEIVTLGLTLLTSLAQGIADNLPTLIPTVVDVVLEIVDTLTDPQTLGNLLDAAMAIIVALAKGIIDSLPKLIDRLPEIIENVVNFFVQNIGLIIDTGVRLTLAVAEGLIKAIPDLVLKIPEIIMAIVQGLADGALELIGAGKKLIEDVKDGFFQNIENAGQWGKDLIENFVGGITQKWEDLKSSVRNVAQTVKDIIGFSEPKEGPLANFHTFAPDMMMLFAKGIRDNEYLVEDQLKKSLDFSGALENTWLPDRLNAAVRGAGAYRFGGTGASGGESGRSAADLARAITDALQGCGVYMDGQLVGRLVTRAQANTARAYG